MQFRLAQTRDPLIMSFHSSNSARKIARQKKNGCNIQMSRILNQRGRNLYKYMSMATLMQVVSEPILNLSVQMIIQLLVNQH